MDDANTTKVDLPVCPYCGTDPAFISQRGLQIGQFHALVMFCGTTTCRKIFSLAVVGVNNPGIVGPAGQKIFVS